MPNHRIARGIHASGEIGRNNSMTGSMMRSKPRDQPIASPSGIAIAPARSHAENTRARLTPVCTKSSPLSTSTQNSLAASHGGGSSDTCGLKMTITACHTAMIAAAASKNGTTRLAIEPSRPIVGFSAKKSGPSQRAMTGYFALNAFCAKVVLTLGTSSGFKMPAFCRNDT